MNIPEKTKNVEINGRKFILKKMDARIGSFMLFKLMKLLPSIIENLDIEKIDLENLSLDSLKKLNLTKMLEPVFEMPEKEFSYIQDNCLKVVDELLNAGAQPVLQKSGEWGVNDIADNLGLVTNLTIQSLAFNVMGFFEGSPLTSLLGNVTSFQQNSKI